MRAYTPCKVLLIDDEPAVLEMVRSLLADSKPAADAVTELFEVTQAQRLAQGLDMIAQATCNIVLLDLNLPDSHGIETLRQLRRTYPTMPIIVLTGMDDEVVAVRAIESGAQGFLLKDNVDPNMLAYALLLALDRQRQLGGATYDIAPHGLAEGAPSDAIAAGEPPEPSEIESFERLAVTVRPATVTPGLFDSGLLKDTVPDIFGVLVDTYIQVLDQVLEQKTFRVEYPISSRLRLIAEQLGFLKAGARDVVELHTLALKQKRETESPMKTQAYAAEGRLIVLELMGYLATYYRKYFIGLNKINAAQARQQKR